jgi:hypothetical protein
MGGLNIVAFARKARQTRAIEADFAVLDLVTSRNGFAHQVAGSAQRWNLWDPANC